MRPSAALAAIAASTAEPPDFRMSSPTCVASGWLVHTMPCCAMTSERVANDRPVMRSTWATLTATGKKTKNEKRLRRNALVKCRAGSPSFAEASERGPDPAVSPRAAGCGDPALQRRTRQSVELRAKIAPAPRKQHLNCGRERQRVDSKTNVGSLALAATRHWTFLAVRSKTRFAVGAARIRQMGKRCMDAG